MLACSLSTGDVHATKNALPRISMLESGQTLTYGIRHNIQQTLQGTVVGCVARRQHTLHVVAAVSMLSSVSVQNVRRSTFWSTAGYLYGLCGPGRLIGTATHATLRILDGMLNNAR